MAFISYNRGENQAALKGYAEALELAERESHLTGQMTACVGLGTVYSRLGDARKSLQYLNRFFDLEDKSGITNMHTSVKLPLILDYARLGRYDDMEKVIRDIDEERAALVREIADLYDRNRELEETVGNLVSRMESQDVLNEAQQIQLRRYRLVFCGCLGIVLALILGWAAVRAVKHYFACRAKSSK